MYRYNLFLLTKSHAYSSIVAPSVLFMLDRAKNNTGFIGYKRQLRQREGSLAWCNADGRRRGICFQVFLQLDWHKESICAGTSRPRLRCKSQMTNSAREVSLRSLCPGLSLLQLLTISHRGYKNGTGLLYRVTPRTSLSPTVLSLELTRSRCLGKA